MDIKLYDTVKLKTGEVACIVYIYEPGVAYEADIEKPEGMITDTIYHEQIETVMKQKKD